MEYNFVDMQIIYILCRHEIKWNVDMNKVHINIDNLHADIITPRVHIVYFAYRGKICAHKLQRIMLNMYMYVDCLHKITTP